MNLTLEITRRCNMRCDHCLRGGPQRVDMDDQTIFKTVYHWPFQSIGIVNFTGGEPSLRPDRIRQFWQELLWQKKDLEGWELTTNAKHITADFLDALERLTWHVYDKSLCGIRISDDYFHRWRRPRDDRHKLYEWGELNGIHVYADNGLDRNSESILGMGRAKKFQLGWKRPDTEAENWEYWINDDDDLGSCEGFMYVNARGQIIDGCDFSFVEQHKHVLGSVLSDNLTEIILKHGHGQNNKLKPYQNPDLTPLGGSLDGFDQGDTNAEKDSTADITADA